MARFMENKSTNPKLKQSEIAKELSRLTSILQRYRNDVKKFSPYRIPPNNTYRTRQKISNTNLDEDSQRNRNVKRPQMTSIDLKGIFSK